MAEPKPVKFRYKNGFVSTVNEWAAKIMEKRGEGKIIVEKKSIVVNGNKNKKDEEK